MLIAQITDIHLGFEPDTPDEFNRQRLDQTLAALRAVRPQPDLLLATGDLIDRGDLASYHRLREALGGLPFPVHVCLGNHDVRSTFAEAFPEYRLDDGFLQYELAAGDLRLLVLDTLEEGRHGGGFCETRADWLRRRLDEDGSTRTLIVQHHPPVEIGIPWMATHPAEPWVERLAGSLAGHDNIVGMICGHVHRAITARWNGVMMATCPSTAPQVALDLRRIDPDTPDCRPLIVADPPGYALHWWNGRELVTHFETADDHQVLARYDPRLQGMIRHMLNERPA